MSSAISTYQAGRAEQEHIENQALALERRAAITRFNAAQESNLIRGQTDPLLGQISASAAGGGVVTNTGSVLDVIKDSAYNIELDAQLNMVSAEQEASALRQEAQGVRSTKPSNLDILLRTVSGGVSDAFSFGMVG